MCCYMYALFSLAYEEGVVKMNFICPTLLELSRFSVK